VVAISALLGTGMEVLRETVAATVLENGAGPSPHAVITTLRHARAMEKTMEFLENAARGLRDNIPPEFIASDLQLAVQHLEEITGASSPEEVLDAIFSRFCIGK